MRCIYKKMHSLETFPEQSAADRPKNKAARSTLRPGASPQHVPTRVSLMAVTNLHAAALPVQLLNSDPTVAQLMGVCLQSESHHCKSSTCRASKEKAELRGYTPDSHCWLWMSSDAPYFNCSLLSYGKCLSQSREAL